ncbi:hypothetical protein FH966_01000 [Lentibacillus cibarius]|uniref:Sporulation protein n=1 Tax=Lentibacillus cibarius TaxID=2583219 RepID=A0A549YEX6_9BACI|nr:hypothetical protein [Lentibacillus cibarius]TMN21509.1 hypothetical protein FFL34_04845 [Lentibacillus cibarius]TRM10408.1 hypothetical protein FH966_01000 [Lentibacillus cibarius]
MKKLMLLLGLSLAVFGCSPSSETDNADEPKQDKQTETTSPSENKQQIDLETIDPETVVAEVDDDTITGADLKYEMKRLALINALQGGGPGNEEPSPKIAVKESIRNLVIHEIAEQEGITVEQTVQEQRVQKVRKDAETADGYDEALKGMDEEAFWSREMDRYEIIIEAEKLISMLMEDIRKDHPDYKKQALQFDARKELDELIQEKLSDMDVEVHLEDL